MVQQQLSVLGDYSLDAEYLKTVKQAEKVIMDTFFKCIKSGDTNSIGGVGETVLEWAVEKELEIGFLEDPFKPAIDNLRKNAPRR